MPQVKATDDYAAAGPQDIVILAMKAHQVEAVAREVPKLFGPDTIVVPMQNGIPYWYFHRHARRTRGHAGHERRPDRSDRRAHSLRARHRLRGVSGRRTGFARRHQACRGQSLSGRRARWHDQRAGHARVASASSEAACRRRCSSDIRAEIWLKLWGNLTFNPISALSRATLAGICQYPPSRAIAAAMMTEAQSVANKLGVTFRVSLEKRIAGAERVGHHKTSMLQDVEAARTLEVDALLGSVVELARLTDTPTPHLDTVYALTKLLAKTLDGKHRRAVEQRDASAAADVPIR